MSKKFKLDKNGIVYSTDPSFYEEAEKLDETPEPSKQRLTVQLETKHRAGKCVTLVAGFRGRHEDMENLGKQLRNHCGTGGSVKDDHIIVQGDQKERVFQFLVKNGYALTKKR